MVSADCPGWSARLSGVGSSGVSRFPQAPPRTPIHPTVPSRPSPAAAPRGSTISFPEAELQIAPRVVPKSAQRRANSPGRLPASLPASQASELAQLCLLHAGPREGLVPAGGGALSSHPGQRHGALRTTECSRAHTLPRTRGPLRPILLLLRLLPGPEEALGSPSSAAQSSGAHLSDPRILPSSFGCSSARGNRAG